jgi:hypothetical protein
MIDLSFVEFLNEKRGEFHNYFFWPVYRKEKGVSNQIKFERLEGSVFRIKVDGLHSSGINIGNFGPDLLFQELSDDFGVAFGTFARKGPKDISNSLSVLVRLGLIPLQFEKLALFEILKDPKNYPWYRLKEYRGKAQYLQSYFKVDLWNTGGSQRAILKRLYEDLEMGLKPYQATFMKENGFGSVKVFESGAILTEDPQVNIDLISNILEKVITEGKRIIALVKTVGVEYLKKAISLRLHTDMLIKIRKTDQPSINEFIRSLDLKTGIYGLWHDQNQVFLNVQFEKEVDDYREVSSSYSVSIEPTSVIATPTMVPALEDTLSLFYEVDKYFQIVHDEGGAV